MALFGDSPDRHDGDVGNGDWLMGGLSQLSLGGIGLSGDIAIISGKVPAFGDWLVRSGNDLSISGEVARSTKVDTTNPAILRPLTGLTIGVNYTIAAQCSRGTTGTLYGRVSSDSQLTSVLYLFHEAGADYNSSFTWTATAESVFVGFAANAGIGEYLDATGFTVAVT